jgi:hypothetical protein
VEGSGILIGVITDRETVTLYELFDVEMVKVRFPNGDESWRRGTGCIGDAFYIPDQRDQKLSWKEVGF